jgi:mono/diheme cytochrome c family protein
MAMEIVMRTLAASTVVGALAIATAGQAQDLGDLEQGRRLALDICASCHAVRAGQPLSPNVAAPTFEAVAKTPGMTAAALTVWLTTSHPTMPNIMLSREQIRDVAAYILSLRD